MMVKNPGYRPSASEALKTFEGILLQLSPEFLQDPIQWKEGKVDFWSRKTCRQGILNYC
jgi:hypothetical protein